MKIIRNAKYIDEALGNSEKEQVYLWPHLNWIRKAILLSLPFFSGIAFFVLKVFFNSNTTIGEAAFLGLSFFIIQGIIFFFFVYRTKVHFKIIEEQFKK